MQKRKVGRPRKTSAPVVRERKNTNWKEKYEQLLKESKLQRESSEMVNKTASEILEKQSNHQLQVLMVVLNGITSIQEICSVAKEITGQITEEDVAYSTELTKRALLYKYNKLHEDLEENED